MNVLNATELFILKWLILCYVNFTSIKTNIKGVLSMDCYDKYHRLGDLSNKHWPWLVWLRGLSAGLRTKGSPV